MLRVCTLAALVAVAGCGGSSKPPADDAAHQSFSDTLGKYGFVELRPPSVLLAPGTIVRLKSKVPLQGGIVCTQKASLGPDLAVQDSPSMDTTLVTSAQHAYQLDLSQLPIVSAKGSYDSVERVTMKLQNVRVLELPDSTVYDAIGKRSDGCKQALAGLLADPTAQVTMIKSVLAADVSYGVDFKSGTNLDANAKVGIVKGLAAGLGANSATATDSGVSGNALYWGVTDEIRLAQVGTNIAGGTRAAPPGARSLPPGQGAISLDATPLAD